MESPIPQIDTQTEFRDKVNYSNLLIRAIAKVQDAQNIGYSGLNELDQVYDILIPEVRAAISTKSSETRQELIKRIKIFTAGNNRYGFNLSEQYLTLLSTPLSAVFNGRFFMPFEGHLGDFTSPEKVIAYFEQQYVSIEIQNIIDELHARHLLLITTNVAERGSMSLYLGGEESDE